MVEKIKIPKILQERQGPSFREEMKDVFDDGLENIVEWRKRASSKMARTILGFTFNRDKWGLAAVDPADDLSKRQQDRAWASYEDNMRETHINEGIEHGNERIASLRQLGSLAMVLTGMDKVGDLMSEHAGARAHGRNKRRAYIDRNGTLKSNMRARYVSRVEKQRSAHS